MRQLGPREKSKAVSLATKMCSGTSFARIGPYLAGDCGGGTGLRWLGTHAYSTVNNAHSEATKMCSGTSFARIGPYLAGDCGGGTGLRLLGTHAYSTAGNALLRFRRPLLASS
ncbi:uncharacterized protein L969DRAFT_391080 [Mixia osmundae IAM 14324]|uniref:uncharacterized protein n=1 Tax=Mixia osmundae (strain CBS 9802 / IAM 14324 / JCM 22182 / KY 12970) TaxID=764103 RepID=UPI0004A54665|nr:uncharacterized protein L969DRAFT_391080 [Mixia osmundae IAM 14324]KEI39873.1 hypothetical protein L969DRAFT_391080 [Mixia osmundae IAM 14324]